MNAAGWIGNNPWACARLPALLEPPTLDDAADLGTDFGDTPGRNTTWQVLRQRQPGGRTFMTKTMGAGGAACPVSVFAPPQPATRTHAGANMPS